MAFPKKAVAPGSRKSQISAPSELFISSTKWSSGSEGTISITFEQDCYYSSSERNLQPTYVIDIFIGYLLPFSIEISIW
jgi:hypothetical protein